MTNPLKNNNSHLANNLSCFTLALILLFAYLPLTLAVTDAELEALEKQIEQQEATQQLEEKKKIDSETKRKAKDAAKNIQLIELEKRNNQEALEQRELEEKKIREFEAQRLLEEERMHKEAEEKLKADLEKKAQHDNHVNKAEVYMEDENYGKAIEEYELLLKSFPDDSIAIEGIKNAQKLLSSCNEIVGIWQLSHGPTWVINDDHTTDGAWIIFSAKGLWECLSAKNREFVVSWIGYDSWTLYFKLSEDTNTLSPTRANKIISGKRIGSDDSKNDWRPQL